VGRGAQEPLLAFQVAEAVALCQQAQIQPVPRQQDLMEQVIHTASLAVPLPLTGLVVAHRVGAAAAEEVTATAQAALAAVLFKVAPPEAVALH
jgi:hypothetical protein